MEEDLRTKNGKYLENGEIRYYKGGLLHREDGPAIETRIGTKVWCIDGKFHREDGHAIEYADGDRLWYLNDISLTEEEFNHWLAKKHLNEKLHSTLEEKPVARRVKI